MSRFDSIYRKAIILKFFPKGWGSPEDLRKIFEFRKKMSNRDICRYMVNPDRDIIHIEKEKEEPDMKTIEGHFLSPLQHHMPGVMPKEVRTARFKLILPKEWETEHKPVCIHLAGTGDHGFSRREKYMAKPLLKKGIASMLLENPYYGSRKPVKQTRSFLLHVSDLFVMGAGLTLESLVLLNWCESQGYGPLGITGISMGGHMACLAGTNWHKPLVMVPCLSWTTASPVYTRGVLRDGIKWKALESQFNDDEQYRDLTKMFNSPEKDWISTAYDEGRDLVSDYNDGQDLARSYEATVKFVQNAAKPLDNVASQQVLDNVTSQQDSGKVEDTGVNDESNVSDSPSVFRRTIKNLSVPSISPTNLLPSMPTNMLASIRQYTPDISLEAFYDSRQYKYVSEKWQTFGNIDGEALDFMIGVMDECTHLKHYSVPMDQDLVIIVTAKQDSYIPRDKVIGLDKIWPGAEVRYIPGGHVSAYLRSKPEFVKAIVDGFDRSIEKYHVPKPRKEIMPMAK